MIATSSSAYVARPFQSLRGFTLFEVALSLVLVSFSVVSVLVLFPLGIKSEQNARMQIYAAVKAEEIIDSFATSSNTNPTIEVEAPDAWDVPSGYRVFSPDLESRVVSHRYGIMPLPLDIVRRLDSDDDEIARVIAEGGQLFYSQASGSTGLEEVTESRLTKQPDALTQKLVFAVVGYAQSNSLSFLPWKAWPYYEPFPSPPGHGEKKQYRSVPDDVTPNPYKFSYQNIEIFLWEGIGTGGPDSGKGTTDGDIAKVFDTGAGAAGTPRFGYHPYALGGSNDLAGAIAYLQAALWYCDRKLGASASIWYNPMESFTVATKVTDRMADFRSAPDDQKWKYVQAMRFLSHAATCMTRHKTLAELGGQPSTTTGFVIPPAPVAPPASSPQITLTHDKIVYYHELGMQMAMLYAASLPYDWGVPRPTQRALFTDYPLIEYDLFSAKLSGTIAGAGEPAQQWRPLSARPITTIGRSYSFPNAEIPAARWSPSANFTLAKPFKAMERCRQLVFWAVDWTSYEDFETAPSAPVDASKYLFSAPLSWGDMGTRMNECTWPDHHVYQFRNPEKVITFTDSGVRTEPTGTDVSNRRILNRDGEGNDKGSGNDNISRFLGLWGADRNFNGKIDRGPVPRSVRMRATSVARFNYYDPRLTLKLR